MSYNVTIDHTEEAHAIDHGNLYKGGKWRQQDRPDLRDSFVSQNGTKKLNASEYKLYSNASPANFTQVSSRR